MGTREAINTAFAAIVTAFLSLVCIISIGASRGAAFPGLPGVSKQYSQLEGRARQPFPELSFGTVRAASFQSNLEQAIADHVPFRDAVLLCNAALQRSEIVLANTVFGWTAYPSKYDSVFVAVPSRGAVVHVSKSPTKAQAKAAEKWAASIAAAAEAHPGVRFVYDVLDDTYTSPANPTYSLVSKPYTKEWADEHVISKLGERVEAIYDPIQYEDELFGQWFLTEHHWRIGRALDSYNRIGDVLGWKRYYGDDGQRVLDRWYGASARSGLDLDWADGFADVTDDFAQLVCRVGGIAGDRGLRESFMRGERPVMEGTVFNFYHQWYGAPSSEVVYENPDGNGKTCLFVEQSYGVTIERYIASNYSKLVCVDPQNCTVDCTLDELIEAWGADDVVIQFGNAHMTRVRDTSPKIFGD